MEVPIQQAARTLGILPSILWRQIENGELKGRKKGRIWYVEHPEKENLHPSSLSWQRGTKENLRNKTLLAES